MDKKLSQALTTTSSSNTDEIYIVINGTSYAISKGDFIGDRVDNLEENQMTGVEVYQTLADLPATGTANVSYKVANDPTASNNGYYTWQTSAYVKSADLYNGDVAEGETEAVSGDTVFEDLKEVSNVYFNDSNFGDANGYIHITTGAETTASNFSMTLDFLKILPGIEYTFNIGNGAGNGGCAWFDENKSYISGFVTTGNGFTQSAPSNAYYLKASALATVSTGWNIYSTNRNYNPTKLIEDLEVHAKYQNEDQVINKNNKTVISQNAYNSNILHEFLFNSEKYNIYLNNAPTPTEETIIVTDDFILPFSKIKKLTFSQGAVNGNYLIEKRIKTTSTFAFSFWFTKRIDDGVEYNNSAIECYLNYNVGVNDSTQKSIFVTFQPSAATGLDVNGYYEDDQIDYTLRCNGWADYDGERFYNMTIYSKYVPTVDIDYIELRFGEEYILAQSKDNVFKFTGFEYYDTLPEFTAFTVKDYYKGETPEYSISQLGANLSNSENQYRHTYQLPNKVKDLLDGYGQFIDVEGAAVYPFVNGSIDYLSGVTNTKVESTKFGYGYELGYSGNLPTYVDSVTPNKLINFNDIDDSIKDYAFKDCSLGFWIDRTELNNNELYFIQSSTRYILEPQDLLVEGFIESQGAVPYTKEVEVVKVDGNYTYVQLNRLEGVSIGISISNDNAITSLTLYNPTIIESSVIDPYYIYKSKSEQNNSKHRGKWLMNFGDSQQNDRAIVTRLAYELGLNICTASLGGHSMKYLDTNWMYDKAHRKLVMAIDYIDYYFFMVSSNDTDGGGALDETSVQAVIDNYYYHGDDATAEAAKDVLFAAMNQATKESTFAFQQTYSAYLKQLQVAYPEAKFLLASIPISQNNSTELDGADTVYKSTTDADAQRVIGDAKFPVIRQDIIELIDKHNCTFVDLFRESGFTYENYPSKVTGTDSVHWNYDVKIPFAYAVWSELDKIVKI